VTYHDRATWGATTGSSTSRATSSKRSRVTTVEMGRCGRRGSAAGRRRSHVDGRDIGKRVNMDRTNEALGTAPNHLDGLSLLHDHAR